MVYIPVDIILYEVLPRVHDSLSIDTRMHFKMAPKKLQVPDETKNMLDMVISRRTRVYEHDNLLTKIETYMLANGTTAEGYRYNEVIISVNVCWDDSRNAIVYMINKYYLWSAGVWTENGYDSVVYEKNTEYDYHEGKVLSKFESTAVFSCNKN